MNSRTFDNIKDILSDDKKIYKFLDIKGKDFDYVLGALKSSGNEFDGLFKSNFDQVKWTGSGFEFSVGDFT
ncbi:hypothetical protein KKG31_00285 [Patescibacteria group bacterium]|nr:hypothetical protein [Patescibacteria group bacterium]MBU1757628.1 hypothetical protein [Patescibacteria group bacterium]